MENNNYICEKHKKIIEEQKPKCKYCELDKLPNTSNRKSLIDKETILKIDGKEHTLIWDKERNNGVGAYWCPGLELYLERFGNIRRGKVSIVPPIDFPDYEDEIDDDAEIY